MLDVQDEIFDMVKPAEAGRITLEDLARCGCAGTVVEILCDHTGFWRYDNRENLPHDDEEDEEEGDGDGEEIDHDDPFTAPF
jgi:serine/threonine-protein phosphatase 2A regulatory subunit B''